MIAKETCGEYLEEMKDLHHPRNRKTELNEEAIIETAIAAMDMLEKLKKQLKEQPGTSRQSEKLKNYALSTARCSDEILDHS